MTKRKAPFCPMCWKCADVITASRVSRTIGQHLIVVGCKSNPRIKSYLGAERYCPLKKQVSR